MSPIAEGQLLSRKLKNSTYKSQSHGSSGNVGIAAIVLAAIAIVLIAILFLMYQKKYRTKATTVVEQELSTRNKLQNRKSTLGDDRMTRVDFGGGLTEGWVGRDKAGTLKGDI